MSRDSPIWYRFLMNNRCREDLSQETRRESKINLFQQAGALALHANRFHP